MADNEYRKYLNGDDEYPRHSFLSDAIKTVGRIGLIAAGGYAAYKGLKYLDKEGLLSEGVSKMNQTLSRTSSYLSGLNKTFREEGVFKTLLGGAQETLEANMRQSFRTHAVTEARKMAGKPTLSGEPTRIEKWFSKLADSHRKIAEREILNFRLEKVLSDVAEKEWAKENPELFKAIEKMLKEDKRLITTGFEREVIQGKGAQYNKEKAIEKALKSAMEHFEITSRFHDIPAVKSGLSDLRETLIKYSDRKAFIRENREAIAQRVKVIKEASDQAALRFQKSTTAGTKIIQSMFPDYDLLTLSDAVKMGIFDYTSLTKDIPKAGGKIERTIVRPRALSTIPGMEDAIVDPLVFINRATGEVFDFRFLRTVPSKTLKTLSENFQIPLLNIRPFRLLTVFGREAAEDIPFHVFQREKIGSIIKLIGRDLPIDDYYYSGGSIINRQGQVVAENITLASPRTGLFQRELAPILGYTKREAREPSTLIEYLKEIYDIGNQEYESALKRKFSAVTKFWNLDWDRNIWYNIEQGNFGKTEEEVLDFLNKAYSKFLNTVDNMTTSLSRDTIKTLKDYIDPDIYQILMENTTEEGTLRAIYKLIQDDSLRPGTRREFERILEQYIQDPESLHSIARTAKRGRDTALPDFLESITSNKTELITNISQAQKTLHMELLHRAQSIDKGVTVGSLVKDLLESGVLTEKQADEILNLYTLSDLMNLGVSGRLTEPEKFLGLLTKPANESQKIIREHLEQMIKKANPVLGVGPGERPRFYFEDYIPIRRGSVISRTRQTIEDINEIIKSGGGIREITSGTIGEVGRKLKSWGLDTLAEIGFGSKKYRAGRFNPERLTTTSFGFYHYFYRLQEGIASIGLGLSNKNMGSAQDIAWNLLTRRILLPLATFYGLRYINFELGNLNPSGEKPNQTFARAYAQMTLDVQRFKDITGLNWMSQELRRTFPGLNLLSENPIGLALKYGTFGLIGDSSGYEEKKYYYEKGYEPIRKGRFWGIGSNTPWYGDRIEYFAPSWYRRVMGEPKYTDVLYGSEAEYWGYTWFPNPRNLFGIRTLLDPYHYERKHRETRPYPVSGGTPFRQIPIVGPLIDIPLSFIFKPPRKHPDLKRAHESYLKEINDMYKAFAEQVNRGAILMIYPGGRIQPVAFGTGGAAVSPEGAEGGIGYGIGPGVIEREEGEGEGYGIGYGVGGEYGGGGYTYTVGSGYGGIAAINQTYASYADLRPIDGRSVASLRDHFYVESLEKAMDPNSVAYRLGETAYSLTEIGGIYGFLANTFFGIEDATSPHVQLQDSSRMTSLERAFWDLGLGGLGGELSEIYRRFLPHRRRQIREYNPIRNQMPDWMPGLEYFLDFKHGDPYVKIPMGEARLPGPGYEAINRLHPDPIFGRYGALDRFKILADVAPWSEQYKYYSKVVTMMHEDKLISDRDYEDVQRIREMVSQRKEKYDLYPYKFKYADQIEKKTVTIERVIDPITFTTKEYPGVAIRMAGIKLPAKTSEYYGEVLANISRYITPGNKIRIGIAEDPLMRYNDDTMQTMPAVVYDVWGDPLQAKLARKTYGGFLFGIGGERAVKGKFDDTDAVTVNALYRENTITLGKFWEAFAHLDTPFHTKFLKVRSPLEHYKRQMLYGKDWQSWSHPVRDWIVPTINKLTAGRPLVSTLAGAALGALFGAAKHSKEIGAIIGAAIGGIPASLRAFYEAGRRLTGDFDYTWIPRRRRIEREIEEYFDILKYVKYRGLYEKARELAIEYEGIDPESIAQMSEQRGAKTASERRRLENVKRWLKVSYSDDEESKKENLSAINARLRDIASDRILLAAGPYTIRALQYRTEYQATLYGADPHGDFRTIYRALPKKDRPFFRYFMTATPEEREEILRIIPKNQRRFYQAKWGLKLDRKPSLEEYFAAHYLPPPDWIGWKPGISLEAIKVKFVQNTALDIGEFGFWPDDVEFAKNAPRLPRIRKLLPNAIDIGALKKVLSGAGIEDVDIKIFTEETDDPSDLLNIDVNMMYDRREDVKREINNNLAFLFSE